MRNRDGVIVHILNSGLPLCGFSLESPREWPKGHEWISIGDSGSATCTDCREMLGPTVAETTHILME